VVGVYRGIGKRKRTRLARGLCSIQKTISPLKRARTKVNDALKHADVKGAIPMPNAVNHHAKDRHKEERHAAKAAHGHLAKQQHLQVEIKVDNLVWQE
jgi:hypothetical protein